MRIMALNATKPCLQAFADVPKAVATTVHARFPIAMCRAVTFGAEQDDFTLVYFGTVVIDKCVAIGAVMAIQAEAIVPVVEFDVRMFGHRPIVMPLCLEQLMAFHAIVTPPHFHEVESFRLARRCFVQVRIGRQADAALPRDGAVNDRKLRSPRSAQHRS